MEEEDDLSRRGGSGDDAEEIHGTSLEALTEEEDDFFSLSLVDFLCLDFVLSSNVFI